MREIVLDTETTGLNPDEGHRIVEIGCIEIFDRLPTGRLFHKYLKPERLMPEDARRVHGLTDDFLSDKPLFAEIAADFISFIEESPLVIHNAAFDMKFLNHEFGRIGAPRISDERAVDTLALAHMRFPGAPASLNALCKRFHVDSSRRTKHGALLDSELLAEVYLELMGGRQADLELKNEDKMMTAIRSKRKHRAARVFPIAIDEQKAHSTFVSKISNAIWNRE